MLRPLMDTAKTHVWLRSVLRAPAFLDLGEASQIRPRPGVCVFLLCSCSLASSLCGDGGGYANRVSKRLSNQDEETPTTRHIRTNVTPPALCPHAHSHVPTQTQAHKKDLARHVQLDPDRAFGRLRARAHEEAYADDLPYGWVHCWRYVLLGVGEGEGWRGGTEGMRWQWER